MIQAVLTDGSRVLINESLAWVVDAIKEGKIIVARKDTEYNAEWVSVYVFAPHITNFREVPR